jgi:hypothetical protein
VPGIRDTNFSENSKIENTSINKSEIFGKKKEEKLVTLFFTKTVAAHCN